MITSFLRLFFPLMTGCTEVHRLAHGSPGLLLRIECEEENGNEKGSTELLDL
jgi:hypothetical protein